MKKLFALTLALALSSCAPTLSQEVTPVGQIAPPNLISARFDGPAKWISWKGQYENRLLLKYEPVTGPLFLQVKIHYRNQNGEGEVTQEPIDITQWAAEGAAYRNRGFKYPGEYTFTVTIRNIAGESSLTLPTLTVQ